VPILDQVHGGFRVDNSKSATNSRDGSMRNGCGMDSIFIITIKIGFTSLRSAAPRHAGLSGIFSPAARGLSAEGRIFLAILLILSNSFI